jgi:replicative DNA helicase
MEMPAIDITGRLIALTSRVPFSKLRQSGSLHQRDQEKVTKAAGGLHQLKLSINDSKCLTAMQMRASARSFASKNGVDLIVIDYLQKMTARDPRSTREQQVAEFAEGAKTMAVECDCPVLALAQLNRAIDSRQDAEPLLSDLRDSGRIEQEADVIMMLWRDKEGNSPTSRRGLSIGKCRNGEAGIKFDVSFACAFGEFEIDRRLD